MTSNIYDTLDDGVLRSNRLSLRQLWFEHSVWSQATFGTDKERGPQGPLKHLAKEVQECLENPSDIMEFADLQFLIFDACRRAGFSYNDLELAVTQKLEINRKRKWGKASADSPVEHIREHDANVSQNSQTEAARSQSTS
jgi:Protein of unknown function (DUF550)